METSVIIKWKEVMEQQFGAVVSFPSLAEGVREYLTSLGFTPTNTLFSNSVCRDEINNKDVHLFSDFWGENFDLAGLGGFPSAGLTGFTAYSHHIEKDGNLLILYGPHVGIDSEGSVGKVDRDHMRRKTSSCGALIGFLGKITQDRHYMPEMSGLDAEQYFVETSLIKDTDRILESKCQVTEVTNRMYDVIDRKVHRILEHLRPAQRVVLLGGIMVNSPGGEPDYFAVRRFDVMSYSDNESRLVDNALDKLVTDDPKH